MRCPTIQQRLDAYLDGELGAIEAQAVACHLDRCAACQAALEEHQLLMSLLDGPTGRAALSQPSTPLPGDFTQRLLEHLPPSSVSRAAQPDPSATRQAPRPQVAVNLLWPWLLRRWSGAQVASVVYAMGTTAAVAAATLLLLRSTTVGGPLADGVAVADLGAGARDYWVEVRVGVDVLGAWASQFWQSLLSLMA